MRYLSLFSGIEAATESWRHLGWEAIAFSEIDKFACEVLDQRHPRVRNLGDIEAYAQWPDLQFDLIVGGSPCQGFSQAGKRGGLDDHRSRLAWAYLGVVERYRPRWIVWENVPGVLSSGGGRDFGAFLGALEQLGYGFAYRVLDAQYTRTRRFPRAVPQRRRRVFLTGYLGDWRPAAAVLFERESLQRNPPPRREKRESTSVAVAQSLTHSGRGVERVGESRGQDTVVAQTLTARMDKGPCAECDDQPLIAHTLRGDGFDAGEDETGRGTPLIAELMGVRRLTPVECERLMGFPRNYTRIAWRGRVPEKCPDGPRYRTLGNSMAVNCMEWIGERIDLVECVV